jgi:hypothetical protein
MRSDISEALRRLVAERADHLCEYCLVHEADGLTFRPRTGMF